MWQVASVLLLSRCPIFGFWQFDYNVPHPEYLSLSCLKSADLLECVHTCLIRFRKFGGIISSNSFCPFLALSSFWNSNHAYTDGVP